MARTRHASWPGRGTRRSAPGTSVFGRSIPLGLPFHSLQDLSGPPPPDRVLVLALLRSEVHVGQCLLRARDPMAPERADPPARARHLRADDAGGRPCAGVVGGGPYRLPVGGLGVDQGGVARCGCARRACGDRARDPRGAAHPHGRGPADGDVRRSETGRRREQGVLPAQDNPARQPGLGLPQLRARRRPGGAADAAGRPARAEYGWGPPRSPPLRAVRVQQRGRQHGELIAARVSSTRQALSNVSSRVRSSSRRRSTKRRRKASSKSRYRRSVGHFPAA